MKNHVSITSIVLFLCIIGVIIFVFLNRETDFFKNIVIKIEEQTAFLTNYQLKSDGILNEAGKMSESLNSNWWLNSGGLLYLNGNSGKTIQGELSKFSKWRLAYSISSKVDTDDGYHPQNIFRLITRSKWQDSKQEAYFKVIKNNFSASSNRNESNGLLFFNRYQDGNDLYYTGIRVDGYAVIKKKINGEYFTMAYKQFFSGDLYDRDKNPSLLPGNTWIGMRCELKNNLNGTVDIKLFVDNGKTGDWILAVEATDDGKIYGGAPFLDGGYAGIRTDFMDMEFSDYKISEY